MHLFGKARLALLLVVVMIFSLLPLPVIAEESAEMELSQYLSNNEGEIVLTLYDADDNVVRTSDQLKKGDQYKIVDSIYLPNGIHPGKYYTQLGVQGLTFAGTNGLFSFNKNGEQITIGEWQLDDSGKISYEFYQEANTYTEVRIYASMFARVNVNAEQVELDGNVYVVIDPTDVTPTLGKTASIKQYDENNDPVGTNGVKITSPFGYALDSQIKTNFPRIYWTVNIDMHGKEIVGKTVNDKLRDDSYMYFSDKDYAIGLGVFFYDETGEKRRVRIPNDDINLSWNENEWSYTFPEQIDGYTIDTTMPIQMYYYSTVDSDIPNGAHTHYNDVKLDDISFERGVDNYVIQKGDASGYYDVNKTAEIDYENQELIFEIEGSFEGTPSDSYARYITLTDQVYCKDGHNNGENVAILDEVDRRNFEISLTFEGVEYELKSLETLSSDSTDRFCYNLVERSEPGDIWNSCKFDIYIMSKCNCDASNCARFYGNKCQTNENGYCRCWQTTEGAAFNMSYKYYLPNSIAEYAGDNGAIGNSIILKVRYFGADKVQNEQNVAKKAKEVKIPSIFKKELSQAATVENGYVALYTITANEGKQDLAGYGDVVLEDTMSDTLVYIPGTMTVVQTDAALQDTILTLGEDYLFTWDSDEHKLRVLIVNPGPYMYTVSYGAQVVVLAGHATIDYYNSAKITLFGNTYSAEADRKTMAEINLAAQTYQVGIKKTDARTGNVLADAKFGLFGANGEKIIDQTSNYNGDILFSIDISEGIILKNHTPYYIKEITPPSGYRADDNKYWFYFCEDEDGCVKDQNVVVDQVQNIDRIYSGGQLKIYTISNNEEYVASGSKTWVDNGAEERPSDITIRLLANGVEVDSKDVSAADNWQWSFNDLNKYDAQGNLITYTITEDEIDSYSTFVDGFDVTNISHNIEYEVSVNKVDLEGNKIGGASLRIEGTRIDGDDIVPVEWVSEDGLTKTVNLCAGTYSLIEAQAPEGYKLAEPIIFTVDIYGEVTIDGVSVDSIDMVDERLPVNNNQGNSNGNGGSSNPSINQNNNRNKTSDKNDISLNSVTNKAIDKNAISPKTDDAFIGVLYCMLVSTLVILLSVLFSKKYIKIYVKSKENK